MGANPTKLQGIVLFFLGLLLIGVGLASGGSITAIASGLALLAVSFGFLMKGKPWEGNDR